jgi:hypothetical protein
LRLLERDFGAFDLRLGLVELRARGGQARLPVLDLRFERARADTIASRSRSSIFSVVTAAPVVRLNAKFA